MTVVVACSHVNLMEEPINFENPTELYRLLEDYKSRLSSQNYIDLTDAIGYLKTVDTKNYKLESYYQSINNKSPIEIIKMAELTQTKSMSFRSQRE